MRTTGVALLTRAAAGAALALGAAAAGAQSFTYFTTGYFSNTLGLAACGGPPPGTGSPNGTPTATCASPIAAGGALSLTFTGQPPTTLTAPTFAALGSFNLVNTGTATIPPGGVFFTLVLRQSDPTMGIDRQAGSVTGALTPTTSALYWTPTDAFLNLDPVTYEILQRIIPGGGTGVPVPLGPSTIEGFVTQQGPNVVPEPSTYALLATGLAGLLAAQRRRRGAAPAPGGHHRNEAC